MTKYSNFGHFRGLFWSFGDFWVNTRTPEDFLRQVLLSEFQMIRANTIRTIVRIICRIARMILRSNSSQTKP